MSRSPQQTPVGAILSMRGIEQQAFAKEMGLRADNLAHVLGGRRRPPSGFWEKVSVKLDVPAWVLQPCPCPLCRKLDEAGQPDPRSFNELPAILDPDNPPTY